MNNVASKNNPLLRLAFESSKGTIIYCHTDPLTISVQRGLAAEKARRFAEMNLTEKELKALIKEYKKSVNDLDIVRAHSIIQEMEYRSELICEENSLFDLSKLYYFIEGEDIETLTDDIAKKKKDIFNAEMDIRAFFLAAAISLTQKFSKKHESDLLTYLEETKMMSARLYRFIKAE